MTMRAAPSEPCVAGSRSSTSTGRPSVRPSCARASAAHGADLARLGLRLAVAEGRPTEVLRWVERWRAGTLRLPAVAPPDDAGLTSAPAGPPRGAGRAPRRHPRGRRRRRRSRSASPGWRRWCADARCGRDRAPVAAGGHASTWPVCVIAWAAASLVELIALEGRVLAVTLVGGRARLHDLAATEEVALEQGYLRASLRRLPRDARRGGGEPARRRALPRHGGAARCAAARARCELPDGPVVIVPTGALHGLSWGALPSLAGRPVTVSPSAELWHRRGRRVVPAPVDGWRWWPAPTSTAVIARSAGWPTRYRGARVLRGAEATADGGARRDGGRRPRPPGRPRHVPLRCASVLLVAARRRTAHRLRARAAPRRAGHARAPGVRRRGPGGAAGRRAAGDGGRAARPRGGVGGGSRAAGAGRGDHPVDAGAPRAAAAGLTAERGAGRGGGAGHRRMPWRWPSCASARASTPAP